MNISEFNITPIKDFKFWFVRTGQDSFNVYNMQNVNSPVAEIVNGKFFQNDPLDSYQISLIETCFDAYETSRPEYYVGLEVKNLDQDSYEKLLLGCYLRKEFRKNCYRKSELEVSINLDKVDDFRRIEKCLDWIRSTDFFVCPASTRYHESEIGGLCKHTLNVVNKIIELHSIKSFNSVNLDEAILTALVHDWCKIGSYQSYKRNVKDELTGQWNQVDAFKRRDSLYSTLGHGVSSLYLASKFLDLSYEQSLAIRWHMGHWRVCQDEVNELQQANECFPLVHMLQFADQLSIVNY